ncbi:MAG: hypothetical protein BWY51_00696 [Parcubacteria group bacterium ADurb.Bin316]|nr:MAG: hypothetical protein BWY51_00696 [Parcubacteria group bacterium ADurb.Bin316]HOZ55637.1 hypothetical protein [bacterium]
MRKKIKNSFYLLFLVAILILPYFVFAQSAALNKLEKVQSSSGYKTATEYTAAEMAGDIVKVLFSLLGIIFTVLILYGGYNWMVAAGDNSKVDKAKSTIQRAIIGLIITAGAYAIGQLVVGVIMMSRQN